MKNMTIFMFFTFFLVGCWNHSRPEPVDVKGDLVKTVYHMETYDDGALEVELDYSPDPRNMPLIQIWCVNNTMWSAEFKMEENLIALDCGRYSKVIMVVVK